MQEPMITKYLWGRALLTASLACVTAVAAASDSDDPFIPKVVNSSTIPSNGDVNPYGVAFVPSNFPGGGTIVAGDVLVSNFNDSANVQGTGTTIVQLNPREPIAPPGSAITFFTSSLRGLSTAIGVLREGFVLVGNVPTTDGTFGTIGQGAIQVIDRHGKLLHTWTDPVFLDGPWDLAVIDHGEQAYIFVSNVLNGTVSRLDLAVEENGIKILKKTTVADGYTHVPNAAAVILGPTGLAYDEKSDTLYVASTADNEIYAVPDARDRTKPVARGRTAFAGPQLRGPLALRFAPNGHLLTANGDAINADVLHPSEIVEFTTRGDFVSEYDVDPSQGGAFGLDTLINGPFNYAVVDDVANTLSVYGLREDYR